MAVYLDSTSTFRPGESPSYCEMQRWQRRGPPLYYKRIHFCLSGDLDFAATKRSFIEKKATNLWFSFILFRIFPHTDFIPFIARFKEVFGNEALVFSLRIYCLLLRVLLVGIRCRLKSVLVVQ
jgi:hypothetical protein